MTDREKVQAEKELFKKFLDELLDIIQERIDKLDPEVYFSNRPIDQIVAKGFKPVYRYVKTSFYFKQGLGELRLLRRKIRDTVSFKNLFDVLATYIINHISKNLHIDKQSTPRSDLEQYQYYGTNEGNKLAYDTAKTLIAYLGSEHDRQLFEHQREQHKIFLRL